MSASSIQSLASTQEDDVASIEYGVSTAASYNTEDESALLNWAALTPPVAYEDNDDDDVSNKAAVPPHRAPHHHALEEEDDETVEVARRDSTRRSIGEEFTARVHELLHESRATLKADRVALVSDDDENGSSSELRVDSEEEGVLTALSIGSQERMAAVSTLSTTPRRPSETAATGGAAAAAAASVAARRAPALRAAGSGPQPPTPRPAGPGRMRMPLGGLAPPPPFFGHPAPHRSMYGGSFNPAHFGPLGFGGPSMRPFNSLMPGGPLPPHLSGGGLGRPLMPPRAYMSGGPPANLSVGGRNPGGGGGPRPPYYHPHPPPSVFNSHHHHQQQQHRQESYHHHSQQQQRSPVSSVVSAAGAAERRSGGARRDSDSSSPRAAFSTLSAASSGASPRTAPSSLDRPPYRRSSQSAARDSHPPTMASLGIGHAAVATAVPSASSIGGELTPYPLVYVSPAGSISCVLNHDIVVEMAVDRSVRIVLHDNFAAFCNARGTTSAILHPTARILHTEDYVYTKFIANNEKMAVFGDQGVLFTMSHLSEAYLVNSAAYPGASAVALDQLQFPAMDDDYTIKMFYSEAQTGQQFIALCKDIVSEATYDRRPDGSLYLHINGMLIRQSTTGDVIIDARPRQISASPSKKSVHVRSGCIDMAVEEDERGYVKRAHKRVHVSRSGMVISDGNCITSMDHFGRIVCCN